MRKSREVIVPTPLYKSIIIFSTFFAIITIVAGFIALDTATQKATQPLSSIDPVLALMGIASIAIGTFVYAFASRFKTKGMLANNNKITNSKGAK